jgi:hypothetical protein
LPLATADAATGATGKLARGTMPGVELGAPRRKAATALTTRMRLVRKIRRGPDDRIVTGSIRAPVIGDIG